MGRSGINLFIFALLGAATCKNISNITGLDIGTCKGFGIDIGKKSLFFIWTPASGRKGPMS